MKESNKKNHIEYSLKWYEKNINKDNFSKMKLYPYSISKYKIDEIDISTSILGEKIEIPFYINAMTGGIKEAYDINKRLLKIAKELNLLIFTGSYSKGLKKIDEKSYYVEEMKTIKYGTNIGIDKGIEKIEEVIKKTKPTFLQVHINTMQEYLQDISNDLYYYDTFLSLNKINYPIILKEVGYGMSNEFVKLAIKQGIKCVDISGKGGANFSYIENMTTNNIHKDYLNNWGITTLDSLLDNKENVDKIDILASGGIKNPLDIVKCLILGAKAVGLSSHLLYLLEKYDDFEIINILKGYIYDIKVIMALLGAKNILELRNVRYTIGD